MRREGIGDGGGDGDGDGVYTAVPEIRIFGSLMIGVNS